MSLYSANHPSGFWKLILACDPALGTWDDAVTRAAALLPPRATSGSADLETILEATLGEMQFGSRRWRLGLATRTYYAVKPLVSRPAASTLRRLHRMLNTERYQLDWPIETRYAEFMRAVAAAMLEEGGLDEASFIHFWPNSARFGLVLTHDVETRDGLQNVIKVADLEQEMGFRSAFNFVPERYEVDGGLLAELSARGFEIGIHDLNHDGKLFTTQVGFRSRARRINEHLKRLGVGGFRAGFLHRNADWMQELDIDYDTTFFDTDPFEPMPGGSMTIWPFHLGHFLEIPTTLVQDHTLTRILRERSPRLWLSKIEYLSAQCGLACLNSHPDYLEGAVTWNVYRQLLETLAIRQDFWAALPSGVFDWWTKRFRANSLDELEGGVAARLELIHPRAPHQPADVWIDLRGTVASTAGTRMGELVAETPGA